MLKQTLTSVAALGLMASVAFAETATTKTTTTTTNSGNYLTTVDSKAWLGSKVIGMPVYTSSTNERIGEVNNIIIEPNGQITALVVGAGGFLGVGERDIAVKFSAFKAMKDGDSTKLTLDVNKEQLKNVAEVKLPTGTNY